MGLEEIKEDEELKILFYALCDGLRQEVGQRRLVKLMSGEDLSLEHEREQGVASALASRLHALGFIVQVESYYAGDNKKLRPDYCIWLPATKKYVYLELKLVAWGDAWRQYYFQPVKDDLEKIKNIEKSDKGNELGNGVVAIGFSKKSEEWKGRLWKDFQKLSEDISRDYYLYKQKGLECINLRELDEQSSYAVVGLWLRKY